MQLPEFLNDVDGEIFFTGHRVGLYHVVSRYNEGESAEMIACRYTSLPLSLVHQVIAFYLENLVEVDAYVNACAMELKQQQAAGPTVDLDALRRRLAAGAAQQATQAP